MLGCFTPLYWATWWYFYDGNTVCHTSASGFYCYTRVATVLPGCWRWGPSLNWQSQHRVSQSFLVQISICYDRQYLSLLWPQQIGWFGLNTFWQQSIDSFEIIPMKRTVHTQWSKWRTWYHSVFVWEQGWPWEEAYLMVFFRYCWCLSPQWRLLIRDQEHARPLLCWHLIYIVKQ